MARPQATWWVLLLVLAVLAGTGAVDIEPGKAPAAARATSQSTCIACHTDAAKLKALTPPDPPAEEQGEG